MSDIADTKEVDAFRSDSNGFDASNITRILTKAAMKPAAEFALMACDPRSYMPDKALMEVFFPWLGPWLTSP